MTATKRYAAKHGSRESMTNTVDAIRTQTPFQSRGALWADKGNYLPGNHWLNRECFEAWCRDVNTIDYVVYSFRTPILWHVTDPKSGKGRWHLVDQRFSVRTASHQHMVDAATYNGMYGTEPLIEFGVWA